MDGASLLAHISSLERRFFKRRVESMHLFSRDGVFYYGRWREWWSAAPEERDALLKAFRASHDA